MFKRKANIQNLVSYLTMLRIFTRKFSSTTHKALYMDMQATTPMDPRVLDAMLPYLTHDFGNPHSRTHQYGNEAEKAVEIARENIAVLIGATHKDIVFTSGATESNNLAIKGAAYYQRKNNPKKKHIITTLTEHKCVLDSFRALQQDGFETTYLKVNNDGLVDLQELKEAIREETILVSVMAVNNEIGVIQPLEEIAAVCKERGVLFHVDAAQATGKIPLDVGKTKIDLMSISAHKMYGPKGIGALYVRTRPRVRLQSQISGGGQERGIRSGTLATPIIVGFGAAASICKREMMSDHKHVSRLSRKLLDGLRSQIPEMYVNGSLEQRYPGNLNVSFRAVEGEALMLSMKDIAVSSGSACTSASLEPSYVLRALGIGDELAHTSLRFGIGRFTTDEEVEETVDRAVKAVRELREMSPLWEDDC
jgi:cysteine desulfurase